MSDISLQEKISILQCVDIFSRLNREELEIAAMNSEVVRVPRGMVVFKENSPTKGLYIVREGEVLITKHKGYEDEMDFDINLAQYVPVECFGELDLFAAREREATAVTVKDSSILVFPRAGIDFPDLLQAYPRISARILHNLLAIMSERVRNIHKMINEKSALMEGLKRSLYIDRLTGLYNRHYIRDEIKNILASEMRSASAILIKPDNFKELNDEYGHLVGDKLLILIAIFIQSAIRGHDIAFRYFGDEFMVILRNSGKEVAVTTAKEIGRAIYEMDISHLIGNNEIFITVSIGISFYPDETVDLEDLIQRAYDRMMLARKNGGNRISIKQR